MTPSPAPRHTSDRQAHKPERDEMTNLQSALNAVNERGKNLPPIETVDLGDLSASTRPRSAMGTKFDDPTRAEVINAAAELYLMGYTQADIAKRFNIAQQTVGGYLNIMRKQLAQRSPENVNAVIQRELKNLELLQREYWNAWRDSKTDQVIVEELSGDLGMSVKTTTKTSSGNKAFLDGVGWCIEQRLKIVGGYAPTRVNVTWQRELEQYGADAKQLFTYLVGALLAQSSAGEHALTLEGTARETLSAES